MDLTEASSAKRLDKLNRWLAAHSWIWVMCLATTIVALSFVVLTLIGRVADNATSLSELQYRSCIEDGVLDFKIAEGDLLAAAFDRVPERITKTRADYSTALEVLRGKQQVCRAKFPT